MACGTLQLRKKHHEKLETENMKELKSKTMMKKAVMINGTNIKQNFIRRDRTNMAELKK